jgi:predicted enzyme related to lactoylglutathione lyase
MGEKGRFVWHDLMTSEPEASLKFYTELFGWETREIEMGGMGKYTFIKAGGRENGGMVAMDPAQGIPSHWLSYLTVDDVDDLVQRAGDLGLEVRFPPTDIPEVGRFAVVADPTGAVFAPFKGLRPAPPVPEGLPPAGAFCWNELLTHDTTAAGEFYRTVCGWGAEDVDMGEMGTYTLFKREGKDAGGMMQMPPDAQAPSSWLLYVAVDDVDETAKRIGEMNGQLYVTPKEIPDVGRFAVAADPNGAVFAIYKSVKSD